MAQWLSTGKYLVVSIASMRPITLEIGSEKYIRLLPMLQAEASDEEIIAALDIGHKIEQYGEGQFSIDRDAGTVMIDGNEVHDSIIDRIISFARKDLPYLPLLNFWRNIQENPSEESREHLFLFLEANRMQITHDGCFIAYKGVNRNAKGDLVDNYTGSFCNNIGSVVTMDRSNVNPNRSVTCSSGLHVAAFEYAWDNYKVLIEVKVNPRDVVAVPDDYNNQKMRVCRYEVVAINKGTKTDVERQPLLEQSIEKSKRRYSEKVEAGNKKAKKDQIRSEELAKRDNKIAALKVLKPGSKVVLDDLTAKEVIGVTTALLANKTLDEESLKVFDSIQNADLKNKKGIVRKAISLLTGAGFLYYHNN